MRFSIYIELSCYLVQPGPCSSSRLEMAAKRKLLVQSGFGKKMALNFPFYLSPNKFSHNYSKSQWNLSYYGRFSIYIELSCDLVQPGSFSSSRFEMETKRKLLVQSGFGKKIAQNIWNNIAPDYLQFLLQIHAAKNAGRHWCQGRSHKILGVIVMHNLYFYIQ